MPAVQCDQCDFCFPAPPGTLAGEKVRCPECDALVRTPPAPVAVSHPFLDALAWWNDVGRVLFKALLVVLAAFGLWAGVTLVTRALSDPVPPLQFRQP